jgi:hypothetical protein
MELAVDGSLPRPHPLEVPPTLAGAHHELEEDEATFAAAADTPLLAYSSIVVAARQQAGALRCCPRRVRRGFRMLAGAAWMCVSWLTTRLGLLTSVYILTGAAQPTLTDAVRYSGGVGVEGSVPLLLPMLASTAGMAGVGLMLLCPSRSAASSAPSVSPLPDVDAVGACRPPPTHWYKRCLNRQVALLVAVDMVSSVLILSGLLLVGSAVYVVMCVVAILYPCLCSPLHAGAFCTHISLLNWTNLPIN